MKKIFAILISMVCIFCLSSPVLADKIADYTFDDGAALNTVTNTLANGGAAVFANGYEGKSLSLNGTYGIYLGDVGNSFSVSAKVKLTSTGGTGTIFFKNMGTSSSQKWTGVLSDNYKPKFWTHGDGYGWTTVASGSQALLNEWSDVLYVENNGVGSLYVNDELIGSGNVAKGSGKLYLGVTYWTADAVSGLIDNVVLYDTDITNTTIELPKEVIGDINLPSSLGTETLTWESEDESIITSKGVVTRADTDKTTTLKAMVNGEVVEEFTITVLKKPVIVNNKVILSYLFDENDGVIIHDVSGNGNHGASTGDIVINENGAVFDGGDDYITMPQGVLYGNDSITIVMTLTPSVAQKHMFAYCFGNTSSTGYMFLNPSVPDTNTLRFAATKTTNVKEKVVASIPGVRIGDTNMVIVTINDSFVSMYVDGDLVMDGDMGMKVSDLGSTTSNYIGKSLYEGDAYFAGNIREFTVYSYCMKESDIKANYGKNPQYAEKEEQEEYISQVSFDGGIDVTFHDHGREDVKVAAVVMDENYEIIEFSVADTSENLYVTKEGTLIVFSYDEENNIPGRLYVKGNGEDFSYEYTPGKVKIITEDSYENGMIIVAGYDVAGALTGVTFKLCDINQGEVVELNGDFDNAVTFKILYWQDFVAMVPVE